MLPWRQHSCKHLRGCIQTQTTTCGQPRGKGSVKGEWGEEEAVCLYFLFPEGDPWPIHPISQDLLRECWKAVFPGPGPQQLSPGISGYRNVLFTSVSSAINENRLSLPSQIQGNWLTRTAEETCKPCLAEVQWTHPHVCWTHTLHCRKCTQRNLNRQLSLDCGQEQVRNCWQKQVCIFPESPWVCRQYLQGRETGAGCGVQ